VFIACVAEDDDDDDDDILVDVESVLSGSGQRLKRPKIVRISSVGLKTKGYFYIFRSKIKVLFFEHASNYARFFILKCTTWPPHA
jgi:hypothetical protein